MSNLNPRQKEAVRYIDGPLLVLAGAGSGKTRVITQKIVHLVKRCDLKGFHIAALTFTNKAAREMQSRLADQLEAKYRRGMRISTFHNLGLNILKREHSHVGLKPGFSIYDAQDVQQLIKELMRRAFDGDDQASEMQWQISAWKNDRISPGQAQLEANGDPKQVAASVLYEAYNRTLRAYNAVDFDDLIGLPVELFETQPEALEHWQNRIRYLLVDEYQDTNATQYRLVQQLVGVRGAFTVVGDDDQSIYAWRGAQPENLALLSEDFATLKVIKLEQNYRSAGRILKAANKLIGNNPHVFEKRLWSELGYGDPLKVIQAKNEDHEAEQVVSRLLAHKFQSGGRFSDYAILYRGNHQSRLFERALRESQIPYKISGGTSFFAYQEVKDIMAYLRLLVNDDDDNAFVRVINTPRREIGPTTLEKLAGYATGRGVSLCAAAYELGLETVLPERAVNRLREFVEWLADKSDQAQRGDPLEVVKSLVNDIRYEEWLLDTANDPKTAERRMGNVHELLAWLGRMAEQEGDGASLSDLVSRMTLMDILERNEDEQRDDCVALMTLHAAKGLEFPHVFMVGVEEQLLPHHSSLDEDNVEEERRLAYVGITRAQKTLTFSMALRRRKHGEVMDCEPSRFLGELPEDDLVWEGGGQPVDPEERQERGKAHLANLKDMLN
ncbi:MAG: DNA helicase Rep [Gammaproteobacteria bacterium]|nr:DNA helicase Rep [Gammaproteobacteria bacterium]MCF6363770.1 DNA helicase Rep [Gammaproteobacteria bacterium]